MFIAANFVSALATVVDTLLNFYMWVIIIRALLSWVNPDPYNPIVQFLYKITEPVLYPIRRMMGTYNIGIDLSPMLVILLIVFLRQFLVSSLYELAIRLR
ncbi:MAG: YggT family protein [Nitrospirae bacterium]|nr:YggT family protein [Candidatus Manganitrophaceae bacterium]